VCLVRRPAAAAATRFSPWRQPWDRDLQQRQSRGAATQQMAQPSASCVAAPRLQSHADNLPPAHAGGSNVSPLRGFGWLCFAASKTRRTRNGTSSRIMPDYREAYLRFRCVLLAAKHSRTTLFTSEPSKPRLPLAPQSLSARRASAWRWLPRCRGRFRFRGRTSAADRPATWWSPGRHRCP
jgi:hypothetical protein